MSDDSTSTDSALKTRHRTMWASGDYPTLASDLIWTLGARVVEATGVHTGDRVLDIAAGSGNAAIAAAIAGGTVIASDLTPELFESGRVAPGEAGVELEWREADAEALPFPDADFDVVLSTVGIMFAPHHQAAADELLRVTRAGWPHRPDQLDAGRLHRPDVPRHEAVRAPLPEGASPAPLWGDETHVRELLGDGVGEVTALKQTVTIDHFGTPEDFRDYFKSNYGPTIAVYNRIADDPSQVEALDAALVELAGAHGLGTAGGSFEWEYLLFTARRR